MDGQYSILKWTNHIGAKQMHSATRQASAKAILTQNTHIKQYFYFLIII